MASVLITYRVSGSGTDSTLRGDSGTQVCATLLGGLVPKGGMRKIGLGDLRVGDKFRCPNDKGPEVEVVPNPE